MNESLTRVILACTEQTGDVGNEDGAPRANEDLPLGAPPDAKGRTDEENGERERGEWREMEGRGGESEHETLTHSSGLHWQTDRRRSPLYSL